MTAMGATLRAEARKLRTTRTPVRLVAGAAGLALAYTAVLGALADEETPEPVGLALSFSNGTGAMFAALLGVLAVTGEFRHRTTTPTFLAEPRRSRVLGAKSVVHLGIGLLVGAVCSGVALAVVLPLLAARGFHGADRADLAVAAAAVLVAGLWGVIGVGVGALVRNQVAAVTGTLAYVNVLEPVLLAVPGARAAYPYLPGGANAALTQSFFDPTSRDYFLDPWQGGVLLLAYAALAAGLGAAAVRRADIG